MSTDTLLYDGHCRLCSKSAVQLKRWAGDTLTLLSFRDLDPSSLGLTLEDCERQAHLIHPDGKIDGGLFALVAALRHRWFGPLFSLVRLPGIRWLANAAYELVSRWRFRMAGRTCEGTCALRAH